MASQHIEVLREVWKITERRNGLIFRTEYVCDVWVPYGLTFVEQQDEAFAHGGDLLVVKSTSYVGETIRTRK